MFASTLTPSRGKMRRTKRRIRMLYRVCLVGLAVLAYIGHSSLTGGDRKHGSSSHEVDNVRFESRSVLQMEEETDDGTCAFSNEVKSGGKKAECQFIRDEADDLCKPDGFVNYSEFYFCDNVPSAVVIIILIVLMLYFFFLIGEVAEDFFAPTMASISETLHLPHNVAGVTFLAIGNGAPDLFSGFVAITGNSPGLGLAALLGAGVFVSAVVVGGCCLVAPDAKLTRRPMIRDNLFLLGTVIYVLILIKLQHINLAEAVILLLIYVVYIGVVIFGRIIYLKTKNAKKQVTAGESAYNQMDEGDSDEDEETQFPPNYKSSYLSQRSWARTLSKSKTSRSATWANRQGGDTGLDRTSVDLRRTSVPEKQRFVSESALSKSAARRGRDSEMETFAHNGATPGAENLLEEGSDAGSDDSDEEDSWFDKALEIIGFPFHVAWVLTVPLITNDDWNSELKEMDNYAKYARWLVLFQSVAAPTFALFGIGIIQTKVGGFPIALIFVIAGAVLGIATWWVSRKNPEEPRFVAVYLILAFLAGAVWILLIANELVSLLTALGLASGINQVVLGLTLLAWGNAVPDTIANTTVAKQGYPQMALGAAFGEPLGNHLLGLGVALIVNTSRSSPFELPHDGNIVICAVFEIAVLTSHIVTFPFITKFRLKKPYAFWLFGLYAAFIVVSVLQAVNVFDAGF